MPTRTRTQAPLPLLVLALVGLLSLAALPARAQPDAGENAGSDPASGATGTVVGEVELSADLFGVGNIARAGGWIGVRVQFRDNTDQPRDLALQVEMRDADGDRPVYRRVATANPGRRQQMWLYVYLPYRFDPSRGLRLTAREVIGDAGSPDSPDAPASRVDVRVGRLLAEAVAMPGQMLTDAEGVLGIIGDTAHGLGLYGSSMQGQNFAPLAHERTETAERLSPLDLPDRWMGLSQFETLVWTSADPADLGPERSRAIREWIERGGHLVIVLSVENQGPWTTSVNNLLRDLFPAVEVRATEGVNLEAYRPMLTRDPDMALPRAALVHTFEPLASGGPQEAMRILDGPAGECVVVRRIVGHGMVTAVGMGVGNRILSNVGLPAADVFWNRILGRRGQHETFTRLNEIHGARGNNLSNRDEPIVIDRDIQGGINLQGQSLAGVVLAFAVFGLYWVVAGPGGFAVLKKTGRDRHAWVGFVAAAGLFTAIAWGGANIIKPRRVEVSHITVIDHVYGQDLDRARSWLSILVPSYLGAEVRVESDSSSTQSAYQLLAPWEGRADVAISTGGGSFPDARPYDVESRAPDTLRVPTRATVKQFQVDWAGPPQLSWPTPTFSSGDGSSAISLDPITRRPIGTLTHDFPAPLENVHVIVIRGQQGIRPHNRYTWNDRDGRAYLLNPNQQYFTDGIFAARATAWDPGTPLDLAAMFSSEGQNTSLRTFLETATFSSRGNIEQRLLFSSFFQQFELPSLGIGQSSHRLERVATHGLDLSRWFSQPCVIVVGTMDLAGRDAMPIPLSVRIAGDERTLWPEGQVVVRWVFPLPPSPPTWPTPEEVEESLRVIPNVETNRETEGPTRGLDRRRNGGGG